MVDLPRLGVGMIYLPGLDPLFEAGQDLIDVIEIEPQTMLASSADGYRLDDRLFALVDAYPHPKLVHGVGIPIGGTHPPRPEEVAPFAEAVRRVSSPWTSEHLGFLRAGKGGEEFHAGMFLTQVQTERAVHAVAANIRAMQAMLPVPLAFETPANYLRPRAGEMSDGAFFGAIAEEADCGILLDLHNLWCGERNGRQPVLDVLAELPLERVWEVHLAGGYEQDGYWLDAHSGVLPDGLLELAGTVLPALPNLRAVNFETDDQFLRLGKVSVAELIDQLRQIRALWDGLVDGATTAPPARPGIVVGRYEAGDAGELPAPEDWEAALAKVTLHRPATAAVDRLDATLRADPGTALLRKMTESFRGSKVVDVLWYTFRMIMLSQGEEAFRHLLSVFWEENNPRLFTVDEATEFAEFAIARHTGIPHLAELAAYDLANRRVLDGGEQENVRFTTDPVALLDALAAGRLPEGNPPGEYEVVLTV